MEKYTIFFGFWQLNNVIIPLIQAFEVQNENDGALI